MPKSSTSKKKKPTSQKVKQKPSQNAAHAPAKARNLKTSHHRSFRLSKSIKYEGRSLPSAFQIGKKSSALIWRHKKLFGGILLIYALLQVVLVQGILSSNFSDISNSVKQVVGDQWSGIASGLTLFSYLLGTAGQAKSAEASVYQSMLLILGSLACIWALRQVLAGHTVRIRDAYYKGMYPLVPFILILFVIMLQTIPLLIGAWLYQTVVSNGIAIQIIEQVFWLFIFLLFATASIYMICSSLFALYIVTLPDMTPMKALRSARGLVLYRRWSVFRKLAFLALVSLVILAIIVLPVIVFMAPLAPFIFYLLTVLLVGFTHAYIYSLYRELLIDE